LVRLGQISVHVDSTYSQVYWKSNERISSLRLLP